MRTTAITVHNNRKLELFIEKLRDGFEIWVVGPVKGQRIVLDHHLTHDNLEAHLEYARPGDLVWRDAVQSEIPGEKHQNAVEAEKTIKQQTFWDLDIGALAGQSEGVPRGSGTQFHLVSSVALLATNKEGVREAEKALLGQWTDGVVTLTLEPNHKLQWSCTDRRHPLNVGEQVHKHAPNWWNFAMWGLALMNDEHKCGTTVGVLRVSEQELHLSSSRPHRMADVFRRIGQSEKIAIQKPEPAATKPKKLRRVAGVATPLLRQLEQVIACRNPSLVERLKPGLLESDIRAVLSTAKVAGAIEPIIQLYSWRNGTALDEKTPMEDTSFFPADIYQFIDLETAISQLKMMNEAARQLREMYEGTKARSLFSGITGSLFPVFNDGATGTIAIDLTPAKRNRVVAVEFESTEPVRQAYGSFDEFLNDAIRANRDGSGLACFSPESFA